jgi:hypothetical protein
MNSRMVIVGQADQFLGQKFGIDDFHGMAGTLMLARKSWALCSPSWL